MPLILYITAIITLFVLQNIGVISLGYVAWSAIIVGPPLLFIGLVTLFVIVSVLITGGR